FGANRSEARRSFQHGGSAEGRRGPLESVIARRPWSKLRLLCPSVALRVKNSCFAADHAGPRGGRTLAADRQCQAKCDYPDMTRQTIPLDGGLGLYAGQTIAPPAKPSHHGRWTRASRRYIQFSR